MARVASIKVLEQMADAADEYFRPGQAATPGIQIVIVQREPVARVEDLPVINIEPTPAMLTGRP